MLPEIIKLSVQNNQTMCPFTIGDQNGFILNFTFTCFLLGQGGLYIPFLDKEQTFKTPESPTNIPFGETKITSPYFYLVYAIMIYRNF